MKKFFGIWHFGISSLSWETTFVLYKEIEENHQYTSKRSPRNQFIEKKLSKLDEK